MVAGYRLLVAGLLLTLETGNWQPATFIFANLENHDHYTIIIIGGGPIGLACGIEATNAGIDYLILEKGCLVNSLYNYPANMTFFSTSERLEIGDIPFVSNNAKPTRAEALEYYRRVAMSKQLNVKLFEKVKEIKEQGGGNREKEGNFMIITD